MYFTPNNILNLNFKFSETPYNRTPNMVSKYSNSKQVHLFCV